MSFISWFSGKSNKDQDVARKALPDNDSSGLSRDDRTRPVAGSRRNPPVSVPRKTAAAAVGAGGQKTHRHAKRELLYTAVREAMIRAGVLSVSYKFKVLSLDPRGDQFMVMMDLAQEFGGQTERLAEIEVMIAQSAKSRYNIRVTAVYWRMNELVSIGRPVASAHPGNQTHSAEIAKAVAPAVAVIVPVPAALAPAASRYEPIQADEVAAFKQALAAAAAAGPMLAVAKGVSTRSGPRSYTLLTGFEDTEMPDTPVVLPALSTSQYGDLH